MIEKEGQEKVDFIEEEPSESPEQQKINLIDQSIGSFRRAVKASLKVGLLRLLLFPLIFIFQQHFIITNKQSNFPDSWSVIFYVIACMMDFTTILNDTAMLKLLQRDEEKLRKAKEDLQNKVEVQITTNIGTYASYLSIYQVLYNFKYKTLPSVSISETVRCLHAIITFYIFGNLALNSQNHAEGQAFKEAFLWFFILSIYLNVFELDNLIIEGSTGTFVERREALPAKGVKATSNEVLNKTIKQRFIRVCRRPFEVVFILSILSMLLYTVFFFRLSLLNLFMLICTGCHALELLHQKHLQNKLVDENLSTMPFKYLHCYKIMAKLTRKNRRAYLFIRSLTRLSVLLTTLAYFREAETPIVESGLFLVINFLLLLGQYLKFSQLASTKLYVLSPFANADLSESECAICLLQCLRNEDVVQLPCFSEHIYHYQCMRKWFIERKECPLCRFSLEIYLLQ